MLISVGILLMVVYPFVQLRPGEVLQRLMWCRAGIWLIILFAANALTALWTTDIPDLWEDLKIKLPLVLLPVAFTAPGWYQRKTLAVVVSALCLSTFVAGGVTFTHFILNYEEMVARVAAFHPILVETGVNHIYFSILLGFSVVAGGLLLYLRLVQLRWWRIALLIITLLNLLFLHTISARTGLVAFYLSLVLVIGVEILRRRLYWQGLAAGMLLLLMGVVGFLFVTPLQTRLKQAQADVKMYLNDENYNYRSVAMRLGAWEMTWLLFRQQPVIGSGMGDIEEAYSAIYAEHLPFLMPENRKLPHNQFLHFLAGGGLLLLLVFLLAFFLPLSSRGALRNLPFLALWLFVLFAMQAESLLERQVGVTFFSLFWLYLWAYPKEEQGEEQLPEPGDATPEKL